MPKTFVNLVGQKFGRLTVTSLEGRMDARRDRLWGCDCECGKRLVTSGERLKNGQTVSCGCFREEVRGKCLVVHGMSDTRPHIIWMGMHQRCYNEKSLSFKRYGARGIRVCKRWNDFSKFWEDMKDGYRDDLTIERKENNGNYEPGNCRWATRSEQARNRRTNFILEHGGVRMTLKEWSEKAGVPLGTLQGRVRAGWSTEDVLNRPIRKVSSRDSR